MIKVIDILNCLKDRISEKVPNTYPQIGSFTEVKDKPIICYDIIQIKEKRNSALNKTVNLDVEVFYYSNTNDGKATLQEKLDMLESIKPVLSTFNLKVNNRNLNFDYNFSKVDGITSLKIYFVYNDDLINKEYEQEQLREKIKEISFEKEI